MFILSAENSPWFFIKFGTPALTSSLPTDMFAERSWEVREGKKKKNNSCNPPVRAHRWMAGALTRAGRLRLRDGTFLLPYGQAAAYAAQIHCLLSVRTIILTTFGLHSQQKPAKTLIF